MCSPFPLQTLNSIPHQSGLADNMVQYPTSTSGESHDSRRGPYADSLSFLDEDDQHILSSNLVFTWQS